MATKTGKGQPAPKSSGNPGSFAGAAEGSGASDMAKSMLPGAFVSMTAGADPVRGSEMGGGDGFEAGPRGDCSSTEFQMGDGQKKRSVTGVCESPYDVK